MVPAKIPCQNGVPHPIALFRHAEGTQRGGDHQSKVQGGDGVHGLVALGKALQEGGGVIGRLGRGHVHLSPEQKANEQKYQQHQQTGGQEVADAVHQLPRCHTQPQSHQKEHQRVHQHPHGGIGTLRQIGGHRHLEGNRGGTGDAKTGPDGEIDQQGEDDGEALAHLLPQPVQPVEAGYHYHTQHRQHHRRGQKAQHGRQGVAPGVLPQKGREDEVPRSEEQGKQHKAHQQHFVPTQFHVDTPCFFQNFRKKRPVPNSFETSLAIQYPRYHSNCTTKNVLPLQALSSPMHSRSLHGVSY